MIDYSSMLVSPLKFFLQQTYTPTGVVERPSPGITVSRTPWYNEVAFDLAGIDWVAVLYLLPNEDESVLLMACLDEAVEPLFGLLAGADFGDEMTKLVALQWPEQYSMLQHSQARTPGARILCTVWTPQKHQWVVADQLHSSQLDLNSNDLIIDLVEASLRTFLRVSNFPTELSGFLYVLGGPDRLTRRLKAMSVLLGTGADIGKALHGGVRANEVIDVAKGALDFIRGLRDVKD